MDKEEKLYGVEWLVVQLGTLASRLVDRCDVSITIHKGAWITFRAENGKESVTEDFPVDDSFDEQYVKALAKLMKKLGVWEDTKKK